MIFWVSLLIRPSILVVVPPCSPYAVAGSTTSACATESVTNVSTAIRVLTFCIASAARLRSGKSDKGSAPIKIRVSRSPDAAARSISVVLSPLDVGTVFQFSDSADVGWLRRVLPGRMPGASPISSAPRTLPRRNAGRNVACGSSARIVAANDKVGSSDSANDARPMTTTSEPSLSCLAKGSSLPRSSSKTLAVSPGAQRIDRCA